MSIMNKSSILNKIFNLRTLKQATGPVRIKMWNSVKTETEKKETWHLHVKNVYFSPLYTIPMKNPFQKDSIT